MSLNESIVEDAALEGFGELGYAVGHGPHLAPGEPAAERDSFSEVGRDRAQRLCSKSSPQRVVWAVLGFHIRTAFQQGVQERKQLSNARDR